MKKILLILFAGFSSVAHAQTITTIAGTGTPGYSGDGGAATAASINTPTFIAFDAHNNLYFAEGANNVVRRITAAGIINTVAGTGAAGFSGDGGAATLATFNAPIAVAIDASGNLFISDQGNHRIRKVDASTGNISTVAGNGIGGYNTDGIPATDAEINTPVSITFDASGNLYIADAGNYRIRRVNTSGIISTYAGYGTQGFSGEHGPAASAELYNVNGLAFDRSDNLYITDADRIRKIDAATFIIHTIAGNGIFGFYGDGLPATSAELWSPYDVDVDDAGNVYIADQYNWNIRQVDASGIIHTVAGTNTPGFDGDNGPAIAAKLRAPRGVSFDRCGNLFISDYSNSRIRKVTYNDCNTALGVVNNDAQKVSVYPNPANDLLFINNLRAASAYRLLSVVGSVIQQGNLNEGNNSISMQSLASGMYLLEVADNDRKKTVTKIIKQ